MLDDCANETEIKLTRALEEDDLEEAEWLLVELRKEASSSSRGNRALNSVQKYEVTLRERRRVKTVSAEEKRRKELLTSKDRKIDAEKEKKMAMEEMERNLNFRKDQMAENLQGLEKKGETLREVKGAYETYGDVFRSASHVLGHLKKSAEQDARYIWYSFYFFLAVCGYIVLKRTKILKMIYFFLSSIIGPIVLPIMDSILAALKYSYITLCHTLDIPCLFDEPLIHDEM